MLVATAQCKSRLVTVLLPVICLLHAACSTAPTNPVWRTDHMSECRQATFGWPVQNEVLDQIVGKHYQSAATDANGNGTLLLVVSECTNTRYGESDTGRLGIARVEIPLDGSQLPWVVSGVPQEGWSFMAMAAGDGDAAPMAMMQDAGVATVAANVSLSITDRGSRTDVYGSVAFAGGSITVKGKAAGNDGAVRRATAVRVGRGEDRYQIWRQSSTVRPGSEASVDIAGDTPVSDLGLSPEPDTCEVETGLRWEIAAWSAGMAP